MNRPEADPPSIENVPCLHLACLYFPSVVSYFAHAYREDSRRGGSGTFVRDKSSSGATTGLVTIITLAAACTTTKSSSCFLRLSVSSGPVARVVTVSGVCPWQTRHSPSAT